MRILENKNDCLHEASTGYGNLTRFSVTSIQISSSVENSFSARIDLNGSRRRFVEGLPRPITLKTAAPKKGSLGLWVSVKDKKQLVRFDEVLKQVLAFWQSKLQSEAYGWGVRPLSRPVKRGGFGRKANTV